MWVVESKVKKIKFTVYQTKGLFIQDLIKSS